MYMMHENMLLTIYRNYKHIHYIYEYISTKYILQRLKKDVINSSFSVNTLDIVTL